jgi:glucokinase
MLRAGIDLGGTKIQAVVVDPGMAVLGQARRPTPKDGGPEGVAHAIAETVAQSMREAGADPGDLAGIGIGSPGGIDQAAGTVTDAANVTPGWTGSFPLAHAVADRLGGLPVALGNDVDVGTNAEFHHGAGRSYNSLIGVFWGTGVGSGIILDGSPWKGRGAAGEIGHMVVRRGGARCGCGRRGCLEAYAGRRSMEAHAKRLVDHGHKTALFKIMAKRGRKVLSSGVFARALEQEDRMAQHLLDRAVKALGAGIASAVNLLDVEAVIIGGGLGTRLGEPYTTQIREHMQPHLFMDSRPPDVRVAELGDLGGAIGAAMLTELPRPRAVPQPRPRRATPA